MPKVTSDCEALERPGCGTVVEYVVGRGAVGLPITGYIALLTAIRRLRRLALARSVPLRAGCAHSHARGR